MFFKHEITLIMTTRVPWKNYAKQFETLRLVYMMHKSYLNYRIVDRGVISRFSTGMLQHKPAINTKITRSLQNVDKKQICTRVKKKNEDYSPLYLYHKINTFTVISRLLMFVRKNVYNLYRLPTTIISCPNISEMSY